MNPVGFAVVSILANGKDLSVHEIIKSAAGFKIPAGQSLACASRLAI
jgi:hypothetical protein